MAPQTSVPLSGTQFEISHAGYHAIITTIGATLRVLRHDDRDLIVPFDEDELRPFFRGVILAPWPNRVVDGRYSFEGEAQQLAITEPTRFHALHGLVTWLTFTVVRHETSLVELVATVEPQQGYPHRVEVTVTYTLTDAGLSTTVTGTNLGTSPAPFGTAPHPYLVAGEGTVDDWTFELQAAEVFTIDGERLLPGAVVPIAPGSGFDFTTNPLIGDRFVDHAFTELQRTDGIALARVTAADGHGVEMSWDERCPWVQVHTADQPNPAISRLGLAVEPMTCPPDAFNSGVDLIVLAPGETADAGWTISAF